MHKLSRHGTSLSRLFNALVSLDHHKGGEIEDDWEYIDILDRELSSSSSDEMDDCFPSWKNAVGGPDTKMEDYFSSNARYVKMECKILSKADIRQRLEKKISKVSNVLWLSRNESAILLQYFKWAVNRTTDEWLACEEKVRKAVGLFPRPVAKTPADAAETVCRICHEDFSKTLMFSASCNNHQICRSCWEGYIRKAINEGPQCLTLRCPEPSCDAAVGLDLIELLSSKDDKIKFENQLLGYYVDVRQKAKWCPSSDCNYALFSSNGGVGNVTCRCLHSFCWSCSGEAHAPVDCNTVSKWMSEASLQSENWMLDNAVTCPSCKSLFEKSFWFEHYTCSVCRHEFCGVCGDNSYKGMHKSEDCRVNLHNLNGDNDEKEIIKESLLRYNHYYKEWTACESSRANALTDLRVFKDLQLDHLCSLFDLSPAEFDFLVEALGQVVECWQHLKWIFVYGYYLPDDELAKKDLLEFMQEEATLLVSQLHMHVGELQDLVHKDLYRLQFVGFRDKITKLTRVIRNYFELLLDGIMNGLSEVVSIPNLSSRLKMSRQRGESSGSQRSPEASPSTSPNLDIVSRGGDIYINSPTSDDSWVMPEPPLQPEGPESKTKMDWL